MNANVKLNGFYCLVSLLSLSLLGCAVPQSPKGEVKRSPRFAGEGNPFWIDYVNNIRPKAERGDAEAQASLGVLYNIGLGVPQDHAEAAKWLRKGAEQGNARAQSTLGSMYAEGQGVPKDVAEANKWYLQAAEWYRKAAEQGDEGAQTSLGTMYSFGQGVTQNYEEAVKWYRRAAEQDEAGAQTALSRFYAIGQGIAQDYVEGYKWANITAAKGVIGATELRDSLVRRMTKEQIAEGQRRAAVFVAKKENLGSRTREAPHLQLLPSQPKSSGSGFFITADGYLLTSSHVVNGAVSITVKTKQGDFPAKLVKADAVNDVALLKVSGSFHALPIVASHTVKLGDSVLTIGFPNTTLQGVEPKLTRGDVNSLAGLKDDPRHFQISVAVQPGNSGGPLVDASGNVVGIVTARLSEAAALRETGALPQVVNYALKSSFITAFLESTPEVMSKITKPDTIKSRRSEDVVKEVQEAAALVLVY